MYVLPEIVSRTFEQRFYRFERLGSHGWVVQLDHSPELLVLDERLDEQKRFTWADLLPPSHERRLPSLYTSPNGQLILIALNTGYAIVDGDGTLCHRTIYRQESSDAANFSFTKDGCLWTAQTFHDVSGTWTYTHELALIDLSDGSLLAQYQWTNHIDCCAFYNVPTSTELYWTFIDHNTQLFDTNLYHVRREGRTLLVEETSIRNELFYCQHPRGHEFVSVPQDEKHIIIRSYDSHHVIREVALADLLAQRDIWEKREVHEREWDDERPLFSRIDYLTDDLLLLCIEERDTYEFWLVDNTSLALRGAIYPHRNLIVEHESRQLWRRPDIRQREVPEVWYLTPCGSNCLVAKWSDNTLQILDGTALCTPERLYTLTDDGAELQLRLFDDEQFAALKGPPRFR